MPMVFTNAREPDDPIVFANDSFLALTGYSREEVLAQPLRFLMAHPGDLPPDARVSGAFCGEDAEYPPVECLRKDGSRFLAAIYCSPVVDQEGDIVQHFLSFLDLSSHVERSRRDASALHTLYENTPGFIAITEGADHRFTFANAAYQHLLGRRQIVGRPVVAVMPEFIEQGFVAMLDRVYATGRPYIGTNLIVRLKSATSGEWGQRILDLVFQPVRNGDDSVIGIFCEGHDVTERAAAAERVLTLQAELIHLSRVSAMGTMATTLAHELNQPLTAISNYAAACRRMVAQGADKESLDRALAEVSEGALRAGEVIRRLRDMTDKRTPQRQRFNLTQALEEALTLVRAGACHNIHVEQGGAANVEVEADRVQIQQVIMNLARNACEATSPTEGGRVKVTVSVEGDEAIVAVEDSGAGVAPEAAADLFEWGDSSKPEGMGIGLSISRTIIEAHAGRIWHTVGIDKGACFSFSLPLASPAEECTPLRRGQRRPGFRRGA
jgi:two-component system sensor kinase FixL